MHHPIEADRLAVPFQTAWNRNYAKVKTKPLRTCPACGGEATLKYFLAYFVRCGSCYLSTASFIDPTLAVAAWNGEIQAAPHLTEEAGDDILGVSEEDGAE